MKIKIVKISLLLISVIANSALNAETQYVQDMFGQDIPEYFQAKIEKAKQLRLLYKADGLEQAYRFDYNPEQAVTIIKEMLALKPDYYRAHYNLGLTYAELKDYQNAFMSFQRALDIRAKENIKDVTILNSYGWVSMNAGNYKQAEELFKKGIELKDSNIFSSNRAIHNNLGLLYFYTQRFTEAKKYLKVARDEYGSQSAANTIKVIEQFEGEI